MNVIFDRRVDLIKADKRHFPYQKMNNKETGLNGNEEIHTK